MPAKHIAIGAPAHEAERQGLRLLVEGLPDTYTVFSNAYVVDRGPRGLSDPRSTVYEVDAIVVAEHGIFCVELKSYRGDVGGNDHDWFVPQPIKSPVGLNRKVAQILKSALRREGAEAGAPYVLGLVFLTHAQRIEVRGPMSEGRVHGRDTILHALRDRPAFQRLSGHLSSESVGPATHAALDRILRGLSPGLRPRRQIREYLLEAPVEQTERYTEYFARHSVTNAPATLRVYHVDPLATADERERATERCRWEAQVLRRVGKHPAILKADAPFEDEMGLCVPFEYFESVTLQTWLDRSAEALRGLGALHKRIAIFEQLAEAIAFAHEQGVVHRLLRPEVVKIAIDSASPAVRITGFELAKQLDAQGTALISTLHDDRFRWAAPEVLGRFSDAEPRSDQFGLGLLLAHLLLDRSLVDSTDALRKRGVPPRVRDSNPFVPQAVDEVLRRMLALSPVDRFPSVRDALDAVLVAVDRRPAHTVREPAKLTLDPDRLPDGTRIGTDYEIRGRLGEGGLAIVYLAKHLVSGRARALKVARGAHDAEAALEHEHEALRKLDHPNIVRPVGDLTRQIEGRLAMVLERVDGQTLAQLLDAETGVLDAATRRRYAEGLFGALEHLEQRGITHKDLKPDNLVVGGSGLTVIDFSLANVEPDELRVGTALYRDPALKRWSHVADRYAAALCLFELYAGRHPFDDRAPMPGEAPRFTDDELDTPGLAAFFRKALAPIPEERHPSSSAMRAAFAAATGVGLGTPSSPPPGAPTRTASDAPLGAAGLSGTALAVLIRAGFRNQGDLVARSPEVLRKLKGLGAKKLEEVLALRARLLEEGIAPASAPSAPAPPFWPTLLGHPAPVQQLAIKPELALALCNAGYPRVGDLASASRAELEGAPGLGASVVSALSTSLGSFESVAGGAPPDTLAAFFDRACRPLTELQRELLVRLCGLASEPMIQGDLAAELGRTQSDVSIQKNQGIDHLARAALLPLVDHLDQVLDEQRGFMPVTHAVDELERRWPAGTHADGRPFRTKGLVVLLVGTHGDRFVEAKVSQFLQDPLVARPTFDEKLLTGFLREAAAVFKWPPKEPEPARASLRKWLPGYDLDPLVLVTRLFSDVRLSPDGNLFQTPVDPADALAWLLPRVRLPVSLDELKAQVDRAFAHFVTWPENAYLHAIFEKVPGIRLVGDEVLAAGTRGVDLPRVKSDPLPTELHVAGRTPEEVAGDLLRGAAEAGRGFRLVVADSKEHRPIAESVRAALGPSTVHLRFEDAFFRRIGDQIESLGKAERFKARMARLEDELKGTVDALLVEHGHAGARIVLSDVGIWGIDPELAKRLVRRIYDETVGGTKGFWAVVIPGVVRERNPLFLERTQLFVVDGTTLPLGLAIPAPTPA